MANEQRPPVFTDFGIEIPPGAHGEIDTLCPQCSHLRRKKGVRCLSVNVDSGLWSCHHCGWAGSLTSGVDRLSDTDARDPYGDNRRVVFAPPRPLPPNPEETQWQKVVRWFQDERGIAEATLARAGVTTAQEFCPVCELEMGHILFPFRRISADGELEHVNTKHRCGKKHFRMEKGAERILWGLDRIDVSKPVIIVEGEMDALAVMEAGYDNVLSVPDGAPPETSKNYASKFTFLESAEELLTQVPRFILAVDTDAPGRRLEEELGRRLGRERCDRVCWPDGIKDANECLIRIGPNQLGECIDEAVPYPVEGIFGLSEIEMDLDRMYERGLDPGIRAGIGPRFDNHYRVKTGMMTVVSGIPSHGKSEFLDNLLVRLADNHDWAIAVCSPENQPLARHASNLMMIHSGKPFGRGPRERLDADEYADGKRWLGEHFAFILPEEPTIEAILDRCKVLIYRMGVKGLVIDPWNELERRIGQGQNDTNLISDALRQLRAFARNNDIHLWLVAHPTKMPRQLMDGDKEPVPTMNDIAGSAAFYTKADMGLIVWRDKRDGHGGEPTHVQVKKVRFAEQGMLGTVFFDYDLPTHTFREAA